MIVKRTFDVVGSLFFLTLFSPLMLVIALLVKLDGTGGPVFCDAPKRVGKGKTKFMLWKFRTMIPAAYEKIMCDPNLAALKKQNGEKGKIHIEDDPRITRIGRFLRRWDLDELPQLINVLFGEMSLVGPRPYFEEEMKLAIKKGRNYETCVEQLVRVKPGITGLWQVSGRNNLGLAQRLEMDANYAMNPSIWTDIKILLKTPYVVLFRIGAW